MKNTALTNATGLARLLVCPVGLRTAIFSFQLGAARMKRVSARYLSALTDHMAELFCNAEAVGLITPLVLVSLYWLCEVLK